MQKPLMVNRSINRRWNDEDNMLMSRKLDKVKPAVNMVCPESFIFAKSLKKENRMRNLRSYDVKKDNEILVNKIIKIYNSNGNGNSKSVSRPCTTSNEVFGKQTLQSKKWEIFRIAQENQAISKRLQKSKPTVNLESLEKTYDRNRNYMKNICNYPSIFEKKKPGTAHGCKMKTQPSLQKTFSFFSKLHLDGSKANEERKIATAGDTKKPLSKQMLLIENSNTDINNPETKVLYEKKANIFRLGMAQVGFFIEDKKFVIKLVPETQKNRIYHLEFDEPEEIVKMQNYYTNYEELIKDIVFVNEEINISDRLVYLNYKYQVYEVQD